MNEVAILVAAEDGDEDAAVVAPTTTAVDFVTTVARDVPVDEVAVVEAVVEFEKDAEDVAAVEFPVGVVLP